MVHEGEQAVQHRAGLSADPRGSAVIGADIPPVAAAFLERQPMLVLGAGDGTGAVWASLLTGPPGFATAAGTRTVTVGAVPGAGDPLTGAFDTDRPVGLLAIEPATRHRIRVNGTARRAGDRLVVRTEQVFANCPKYIQARELLASTRDEAGSGAATVVVGDLGERQRRWVTAADTFFVATQAPGLGADASHRGGYPGFVTVTGPGRLSWPDYLGNSMYLTLGNLALDPRCGLLFVDWERGHTLQVTGRATVDWDAARAAATPGAQRFVDLDVDRVIETTCASPQRWAFVDYHRFLPR